MAVTKCGFCRSSAKSAVNGMRRCSDRCLNLSRWRLFRWRGPVGMELTITAVTDSTLRISIAAVDEATGPVLRRRQHRAAQFCEADIDAPRGRRRAEHPVGRIQRTRIATRPLRVAVEHPKRGVVQELNFRPGLNQIGFGYNNAPVWHRDLGAHPIDRRGAKDIMRNGAGDNLRVFGARNPIPWVMGKGWGIYFHEPGGQFRSLWRHGTLQTQR